jgi:hypothetical protein
MSNNSAGWRNRIVEIGVADPRKLTPNPRNWRKHPGAQRAAMAETLEQLGWLMPVIVNRRTGLLVDGHMRSELAVAAGLDEIPVAYVELDETEERLALATIDPLGDMARRNAEKLRALLKETSVSTSALKAMTMQLDAWAAGDQEGTPENRGRKANQKGKAWERELANRIGGERVGQKGGKDDVQHPRFAIQAKVGKAFPERFWSWLSAIPTLPGQRRALIIGDAPGAGYRRRAVVILELREWEDAEGLAPFETNDEENS